MDYNQNNTKGRTINKWKKYLAGRNNPGITIAVILIVTVSVIITGILFTSLVIKKATSEESVNLILKNLDTESFSESLGNNITENLKGTIQIPGITDSMIEEAVNKNLADLDMKSFITTAARNYISHYLYGKDNEIFDFKVIDEFTQNLKDQNSLIDASVFDQMNENIKQSLDKKVTTLNEKLQIKAAGHTISVDNLGKLQIILTTKSQYTMVAILVLCLAMTGLLYNLKKGKFIKTFQIFGICEICTGTILLFFSLISKTVASTIIDETLIKNYSVKEIINQTLVHYSLVFIGIGFCFIILYAVSIVILRSKWDKNSSF